MSLSVCVHDTTFAPSDDVIIYKPSPSCRDYPDFYTKLYRLLDANLLHVRYRSRFLRLLDTFLAST